MAAPAQNPNITQIVVDVPPISQDIVNIQDIKSQDTATRNTRSQITQSRDLKKCFFNGQWYPAGTVINSDRSLDWCYGSYCDVDGMVKHWDDFNCGGAAQNTAQQESNIVIPQQAPVTPSPYIEPPTTTTDYFGQFGCWYRGRFYWSGTDIENFRRGFLCYGKYCDWEGRLQSWSDDCRYSILPTPAPLPDFT